MQHMQVSKEQLIYAAPCRPLPDGVTEEEMQLVLAQNRRILRLRLEDNEDESLVDFIEDELLKLRKEICYHGLDFLVRIKLLIGRESARHDVKAALFA